jgi:hypothetical protein
MPFARSRAEPWNEHKHARVATLAQRPLQNTGFRDEIAKGEDRSRRNIAIFRGFRDEARQ